MSLNIGGRQHQHVLWYFLALSGNPPDNFVAKVVKTTTRNRCWLPTYLMLAGNPYASEFWLEYSVAVVTIC